MPPDIPFDCPRRLSIQEGKDIDDVISDMRGKITRERITLKPAFKVTSTAVVMIMKAPPSFHLVLLHPWNTTTVHQFGDEIVNFSSGLLFCTSAKLAT